MTPQKRSALLWRFGCGARLLVGPPEYVQALPGYSICQAAVRGRAACRHCDAWLECPEGCPAMSLVASAREAEAWSARSLAAGDRDLEPRVSTVDTEGTLRRGRQDLRSQARYLSFRIPTRRTPDHGAARRDGGGVWRHTTTRFDLKQMHVRHGIRSCRRDSMTAMT